VVALVEAQVRVAVLPLVTLVGLAPSERLGEAAVTVTVADWDAVPPGPSQVRVNFVVALNVTVLCEPFVACDPVQPPDAEQEAALVDDQVSVVGVPLITVLGLADNVTAGAAAVTDTVTVCVAFPPAPVQFRLYEALALRAPVDCEPLVAWFPAQEPAAVQLVAFVADQFKVALLPLMMVLGVAAKLTVGTGAVTETVAYCDALPPAPVQVNT
jgi:hypothetical protein